MSVQYLERVDDERVSRAEDDGDGRVDVGVGAAHHGGEPRAEVDLQQRVDPGQEQDGLDHDRLLILHACVHRSISTRKVRANEMKGSRTEKKEVIQAGSHTWPPPMSGTMMVAMTTVVPSITR